MKDHLPQVIQLRSAIHLSDGAVALLRRPKNADLIRARRIAPERASHFELACELLAQVTTLNGKPCAFANILNLPLSDIDRLAEETSKALSSRATALAQTNTRGENDAARDARLPAKYGTTSAGIREMLMHPPKERKRKRAAASEMPAFVFHGPVTIVVEAKKR
jgi:hypothetical protein